MRGVEPEALHPYTGCLGEERWAAPCQPLWSSVERGDMPTQQAPVRGSISVLPFQPCQHPPLPSRSQSCRVSASEGTLRVWPSTCGDCSEPPKRSGSTMPHYQGGFQRGVCMDGLAEAWAEMLGKKELLRDTQARSCPAHYPETPAPPSQGLLLTGSPGGPIAPG